MDLSFDIAIHDTFYIISYQSIFRGFALVFLLFLILYRTRFDNSEPRHPYLGGIHYGLTLLFFGFFLITANYSYRPPVYSDYSVYQDNSLLLENNTVTIWVLSAVVLLIISQLIFLLNLVYVKNENDV